MTKYGRIQLGNILVLGQKQPFLHHLLDALLGVYTLMDRSAVLIYYLDGAGPEQVFARTIIRCDCIRHDRIVYTSHILQRLRKRRIFAEAQIQLCELYKRCMGSAILLSQSRFDLATRAVHTLNAICLGKNARCPNYELH